MLNILAGALGQKNRFEVKTTEEYVVRDTNNLESIGFYDPNPGPVPRIDMYEVSFVPYHKMYEHDFARMQPFLVAKGRAMMAGLLEPYKEHVKRIHTDGFLVDQKIDKFVTTGHLGNVAYKKFYPNGKVIHANKIEGEFIKF